MKLKILIIWIIVFICIKSVTSVIDYNQYEWVSNPDIWNELDLVHSGNFTGDNLTGDHIYGDYEHTLNGSNHTGNLSSNRVVKDSGTNYLGILIDVIIDYLFDRDTAMNETINSINNLSNTSIRDIASSLHNQNLNTTDNVTFSNITSSNATFDNATVYDLKIINAPSPCPFGSSITYYNASHSICTNTNGVLNSTAWNVSGNNIVQANPLNNVNITGNVFHSGNITNSQNATFGIFNNGTCIVIGDLSYVTEC